MQKRRALTLLELLVCLACLGVLGVLMGGANLASRVQATRTRDKLALHHIGIAMALFRESNDQLWPGWVSSHDTEDYWANPVKAAHHGRRYAYDAAPTIEPQNWVEETGGPFWQLHASGYFNGYESLESAGLDADPPESVSGTGYPGKPMLYGDGAQDTAPEAPWEPYSGRKNVIGHVEFAYDLGRVDKNSVPERAVAGNLDDILVEYSWGNGDVHIRHGYDATWGDGAMVLYSDVAVQFARRTKFHIQWERTNLVPANGDALSPYADDKTRFLSEGFIPNPRMDEDQAYNPDDPSLSDPDQDVDDIYIIECDTDGVPIKDSPGDYGEGPGWLSPVGEMHGGSTPWRTPCNMGYRYDMTTFPDGAGLIDPTDDDLHTRKVMMPTTEHGNQPLWSSSWVYPQRDAYADEIRWNKHDARLIAGPPFYRGGGMGGGAEGFRSSHGTGPNWRVLGSIVAGLLAFVMYFVLASRRRRAGSRAESE